MAEETSTTSESGSSTTGDGDGDTTGDGDGSGDGDGDGDGDGSGAPCSPDMPCAETEFCDMQDCGLFVATGVCRARPGDCANGGPGACGCEGQVATNACELQAGGQDDFRFGGCTIGDPGTFACADLSCDVATEFCSISFNDVIGPDQPEFFPNCSPLPDGCVQGDCACISAALGGLDCYAGTGNVVVFYPGG
jgi:hypothetical protein